jgi:predicted HTH domain antitoxin
MEEYNDDFETQEDCEKLLFHAPETGSHENSLPVEIPNVWVECHTTDGDVYYYNRNTDATVWEDPNCLEETKQEQPLVKDETTELTLDIGSQIARDATNSLQVYHKETLTPSQPLASLYMDKDRNICVHRLISSTASDMVQSMIVSAMVTVLVKGAIAKSSVARKHIQSLNEIDEPLISMTGQIDDQILQSKGVCQSIALQTDPLIYESQSESVQTETIVVESKVVQTEAFFSTNELKLKENETRLKEKLNIFSTKQIKLEEEANAAEMSIERMRILLLELNEKVRHSQFIFLFLLSCFLLLFV